MTVGLCPHALYFVGGNCPHCPPGSTAYDQVACYTQYQGCAIPTLVQLSGKLYGRSVSDSSELTITAQTNLEMSLDGHTILTPVFIQPGSDLECLLKTDVLP